MVYELIGIRNTDDPELSVDDAATAAVAGS
jgi:hypothetical protein